MPTLICQKVARAEKELMKAMILKKNNADVTVLRGSVIILKQEKSTHWLRKSFIADENPEETMLTETN